MPGNIAAPGLQLPPVPVGARALAATPAEQSASPFDQLYIGRPRRWLAVILLAYLAAGIWFALLTPPWQAPDEPAHYNYVAHIAIAGELPVLRMGDYNQDQIGLLLSAHFAPMLSTAGLRYESYQPPLYYLLAAPVFWFTGGNLFSLRLFGVAIGVATIYLLYACLELVFPGKSLIAVGAAAFTAFLPMHIAMLAAVNNDGLAELLLVASILVLLQWMHNQYHVPHNSDASGALDTRQRNQLVLLGILLGLGMMTKIYAYLLLPVAVVVVIWVTWRQPALDGTSKAGRRAGLAAIAEAVLWVALPACVMALPWWLRNIRLYGAWDVLGLRWHDAVVVGQPRTADWIASNGWVAYGERAFGFTFRSFWGVFGWMGVFMDERIYTALLLFTGVIFLGVLWATVRFISGTPDTDMDRFQINVLVLFAIMLLAVIASYLAYNTKFVQHQGRYFFWGLLPIATVVALGWREVMQPLQGVITGLLAAVMAVASALTGYLAGSMEPWTVLSITLIALALLLQPLLLAGTQRYRMRWMPDRIQTALARPPLIQAAAALRAGVWALPFVLLFLLDCAIPILFIVPQLRG